jgi:hypothetical protein
MQDGGVADVVTVVAVSGGEDESCVANKTASAGACPSSSAVTAPKTANRKPRTLPAIRARDEGGSSRHLPNVLPSPVTLHARNLIADSSPPLSSTSLPPPSRTQNPFLKGATTHSASVPHELGDAGSPQHPPIPHSSAARVSPVSPAPASRLSALLEDVQAEPNSDTDEASFSVPPPPPLTTPPSRNNSCPAAWTVVAYSATTVYLCFVATYLLLFGLRRPATEVRPSHSPLPFIQAQSGFHLLILFSICRFNHLSELGLSRSWLYLGFLFPLHSSCTLSLSSVSFLFCLCASHGRR